MSSLLVPTGNSKVFPSNSTRTGAEAPVDAGVEAGSSQTILASGEEEGGAPAHGQRAESQGESRAWPGNR